jgi:hypothetical protein
MQVFVCGTTTLVFITYLFIDVSEDRNVFPRGLFDPEQEGITVSPKRHVLEDLKHQKHRCEFLKSHAIAFV